MIRFGLLEMRRNLQLNAQHLYKARKILSSRSKQCRLLLICQVPTQDWHQGRVRHAHSIQLPIKVRSHVSFSHLLNAYFQVASTLSFIKESTTCSPPIATPSPTARLSLLDRDLIPNSPNSLHHTQANQIKPLSSKYILFRTVSSSNIYCEEFPPMLKYSQSAIQACPCFKWYPCSCVTNC